MKQAKNKSLWVKISPLPITSGAMSDLMDCGFIYHEKGFFSSPPKRFNSAMFGEILSNHGVWATVLMAPPKLSKIDSKSAQMLLFTGALKRVV